MQGTLVLLYLSRRIKYFVPLIKAEVAKLHEIYSFELEGLAFILVTWMPSAVCYEQ